MLEVQVETLEYSFGHSNVGYLRRPKKRRPKGAAVVFGKTRAAKNSTMYNILFRVHCSLIFMQSNVMTVMAIRFRPLCYKTELRWRHDHRANS